MCSSCEISDSPKSVGSEGKRGCRLAILLRVLIWRMSWNTRPPSGVFHGTPWGSDSFILSHEKSKYLTHMSDSEPNLTRLRPADVQWSLDRAWLVEKNINGMASIDVMVSGEGSFS